MKKHLLLAFLAITIVVSCKKEKKAPVTAAFTTTKSNYYLTEPVSFNNSSANATGYQWDFGDGQSSTSQSPQHTFTTAGIYEVKLTANGNVTSSKKVKIYAGTASYEVDNNVSGSLQLVSFNYDVSGNLIDFKDHGIIATNGRSDTIFTNNTNIFIGGYLGAKTFRTVTPYPVTIYMHNKLALTDNTQVYVSAGVNTPKIQSMPREKSNAQSLKSLIE